MVTAYWYSSLLCYSYTPPVCPAAAQQGFKAQRSTQLPAQRCSAKSWGTSPTAPNSQYSEAGQKLVPKRKAVLAWFGLELCYVGFRATVLQLPAFSSPQAKYCDPVQSRERKDFDENSTCAWLLL